MSERYVSALVVVKFIRECTKGVSQEGERAGEPLEGSLDRVSRGPPLIWPTAKLVRQRTWSICIDNDGAAGIGR